jgi:hypothetical protein
MASSTSSILNSLKSNASQKLSDFRSGMSLGKERNTNERQFTFTLPTKNINIDPTKPEKDIKDGLEEFDLMSNTKGTKYSCTVKISIKNATILKKRILAILINARQEYFKDIDCKCPSDEITNYASLIKDMLKLDEKVKVAKKKFEKFANGESMNLQEYQIGVALVFLEKKVITNVRGNIVDINFKDSKLKIEYNGGKSKPVYTVIKAEELCVVPEKEIEKKFGNTTESASPAEMTPTTVSSITETVLSNVSTETKTGAPVTTEQITDVKKSTLTITGPTTDDKNLTSVTTGSTTTESKTTGPATTATETSTDQSAPVVIRGGSRNMKLNDVYSATSDYSESASVRVPSYRSSGGSRNMKLNDVFSATSDYSESATDRVPYRSSGGSRNAKLNDVFSATSDYSESASDRVPYRSSGGSRNMKLNDVFSATSDYSESATDRVPYRSSGGSRNMKLNDVFSATSDYSESASVRVPYRSSGGSRNMKLNDVFSATSDYSESARHSARHGGRRDTDINSSTFDICE